MILNIVLVIVGIVLVLVGADKMTDGAVAIATKLKIPEMVIGLTIVAMGTSAPELAVSIMSAINDSAALAVGNVLGSNTFNTMLIVGITAIICPMAITKNTVKKDIPFAVVGSALLFWFAYDTVIELWEAAVFFACFIVFMIYTLRQAKNGQADVEGTDEEIKNMPIWKAILFVVGGIAALIYGSNLFVDSASAIALSLGVSEAVVGLTIVAGGTSLPELATSIASARKGQVEMAIGNVIGSNVFNIFMILGITGLISHPLVGEGITTLDLSMTLGSILLLWFFTYTKYKVERWEGWVLTLGVLAYISYLVYQVISAQAA